MPRHGFNFQWMVSWAEDRRPQLPDEKALDFMAALGFDFARIPTDYRFWTRDFDYFHPDEQVFQYLDQYLQACRSRGIQLSLNMHRAPGYCINRNDLERDNLWQPGIAQEAFVFLWETFARRYAGVPSETLSFDLLNEPSSPGEYGLTREGHAALIRRTVLAIRQIDPLREIVIDGLGGGHMAMPELASLGVIHSGRGYQPMAVSHYLAEWWSGSRGMPIPVYPQTDWDGKIWDRQQLKQFYQPWREVEAAGAPVHIGEFGCYNKTPNDVALRWFGDLFSLYKEFGWGYSLWEFSGSFGIIGHGRPGTYYEDFLGYSVDRALLDLMLENRTNRA